MKKIVFLLLSCFSLLFLVSCEEEIKPLDEILNYKITIDPEQNGNLRMNYEIQWQVLDDSREGPLEWVKIGVPNKYISSLESKSSAIKKISYYPEDGAYVRLDLDKKYYHGAVVDLNFSFLQSHIFTLKENQVQYEFIPGWFDEIQVKELTVCWNKNGVLDYNKTTDRVHVTENDQYYIWKTSLDFGESIKVDVIYDKTYFTDLDEANTYSDDTGDDSTIITIIVLCIIGVIFLSILVGILVNYSLSDGYYQYRGFSGSHRRYYWWYSTGYHRSGAKIEDPRIVNSHSSAGHGGFSCACACACAGGGRAGCSRKDFYQPALKIEDVIKKLNDEDK